MQTLKVLIVEDDPLIALDLEGLVKGVSKAEVAICSSLAEADLALHSPIDLALLDIDLPDGKSFSLAQRLANAGTAFAFVTVSNRAELPSEFRNATVISKPFRERDIKTLVIEQVTSSIEAWVSNDNGGKQLRS